VGQEGHRKVTNTKVDTLVLRPGNGNSVARMQFKERHHKVSWGS